MFAVVEIAGTQEMVKEGATLRIPLQDAEKGKKVLFGQVLMLSEGDDVTLGAPYIDGASVEVTVVDHGRGDKIRIVKAHRRKRYRRIKGHQQKYTEVKVT